MGKEVGIVVVTYNRLQLLKEVIESLRKQAFQDFQIIVVNNGSTDETSQWLLDQKDIYTITQKNLGGAGGFFTGMKYVAENEYRYCWIMDDDVICDRNALAELLKVHSDIDNVGFVCSSVFAPNGLAMNSPHIDCRNNLNSYPGWYDIIDKGAIKVDAATFVSVLFTTDLIRKIGLPYKEFFIWGDDSEYTSRISAKYPCFMAINSRVIHKRKVSQSLSFLQENDSCRLKFFYYKFRNESFVHRIRNHGIRKYSFMLQYLRTMAICFIKLDFRRLSILLRSKFAAITFNPQIFFPNK